MQRGGVDFVRTVRDKAGLSRCSSWGGWRDVRDKSPRFRVYLSDLPTAVRRAEGRKRQHAVNLSGRSRGCVNLWAKVLFFHHLTLTSGWRRWAARHVIRLAPLTTKLPPTMESSTSLGDVGSSILI